MPRGYLSRRIRLRLRPSDCCQYSLLHIVTSQFDLPQSFSEEISIEYLFSVWYCAKGKQTHKSINAFTLRFIHGVGEKPQAGA